MTKPWVNASASWGYALRTVTVNDSGFPGGQPVRLARSAEIKRTEKNFIVADPLDCGKAEKLRSNP
jgi:hypothetical protein